MVKAVTGSAALNAVNGVTNERFGSVSAKAAAVFESAVKWVKKPTATGGSK